MSLQDLLEKCKSDKVFIALVVILVGIGSFGLGRLSKIEILKRGISIEAPAAVVESLEGQNKALNRGLETTNPVSRQTNNQNATINGAVINNAAVISPAQKTESIQSGGQVVASKSGTKYHFPWCSGAKTISEKNKIWFDSPEAARVAGYTPAANCKGLK